MGRTFQSPKLSPDEQKQPIGPSHLAVDAVLATQAELAGVGYGEDGAH